MKKIYFIIILVFTSSLIAQTKDISKLTSAQKKEELIETLNWIQTKTGKEFYHRGFGGKIYNLIDFDVENPSEIKVNCFFYDTDIKVLEYTLNLRDIFKAGIAHDGRTKTVYLETYEKQRLIKYIKNGESYITPTLDINYDNLVNDERILKAFDYAIKLSNGGKKIINEKF